MRSLLKFVVILFCVERGQGHLLRSLIGKWRLKWRLEPMTFRFENVKMKVNIVVSGFISCINDFVFSRSETTDSICTHFSRWGQKEQLFSCGKQPHGSFWSRTIFESHRTDPSSITPLSSGLPVRPPLHPAAGSGPGAGLQLRWDYFIQVLQRHVSPCALQPRPHPHQPAAHWTSPQPSARGAVAQCTVLQAHPPRGRGLSW